MKNYSYSKYQLNSELDEEIGEFAYIPSGDVSIPKKSIESKLIKEIRSVIKLHQK